jgi:plasmid stabilization system protein ParE
VRIRWEDGAVDDLAEIARRAPRAAAHVYEAIVWLGSIPFPSAFRQFGEKVDERAYTVPPYVVVYRVVGDDIVIDAIFDARRYEQGWWKS